jgi:hypothetical protein
MVAITDPPPSLSVNTGLERLACALTVAVKPAQTVLLNVTAPLAGIFIYRCTNYGSLYHNNLHHS